MRYNRSLVWRLTFVSITGLTDVCTFEILRVCQRSSAVYTDLTKWNGSSQAHSFVPIYRYIYIQTSKKLRPPPLVQYVNFEKKIS